MGTDKSSYNLYIGLIWLNFYNCDLILVPLTTTKVENKLNFIFVSEQSTWHQSLQVPHCIHSSPHGEVVILEIYVFTTEPNIITFLIATINAF
jgi:hypothetical protein